MTLENMNVPLLDMRGITKIFGDVRVLSDVSMTLNAGEVHCLVGENGAGKSTLMKILSGLYHANAGEILVQGQAVTIRSPIEGLTQGIGVVYQELELVPDLTVAENISLGHEPLRGKSILHWPHMRKAAERALERVGAPLDPRRVVRTLNVAEKQLVAIAKALSFYPQIMVLDEPSAVLAGRDLERLFELVSALRDEGQGIIYISHRMEEIFEIGDRVSVLRDGHIVATSALASVSEEELIQMMVGRELRTRFPERPLSVTETPRLTVQHLSGQSLQDVSFTLHAGEILGCAGLVGSGLDELGLLLAGVLAKQQGDIWVNEKPVQCWTPRDAIAAGVAFVPEDRKTQGLVLNQSIEDNIAYASITRNHALLGALNLRALRELAWHYQNQLHIKTASIGLPVENLSGGTQQKVVLAKALSIHPRVLLLDEPTRGVDIGTKAEIYQMIVHLASEGHAILLISSELPELTALSHRLLVFASGQVTAEMRPPYVETDILAQALPAAVTEEGRLSYGSRTAPSRDRDPQAPTHTTA